MYLIITALAAAATTLLWHRNRRSDKRGLGALCLMYWGATLMWLVDCIAVVISGEGEIIDTSLNAALLGISAVILGLAVWFMISLIKSRRNSTQKTATM